MTIWVPTWTYQSPVRNSSAWTTPPNGAKGHEIILYPSGVLQVTDGSDHSSVSIPVGVVAEVMRRAGWKVEAPK